MKATAEIVTKTKISNFIECCFIFKKVKGLKELEGVKAIHPNPYFGSQGSLVKGINPNNGNCY